MKNASFFNKTLPFSFEVMLLDVFQYNLRSTSIFLNEVACYVSYFRSMGRGTQQAAEYSFQFFTVGDREKTSFLSEVDGLRKLIIVFSDDNRHSKSSGFQDVVQAGSAGRTTHIGDVGIAVYF